MMSASWTILLGLALAGAAMPSAKWLGQDGHDYIDLGEAKQPSEVQDIHIALAGLPPERTIVKVVVYAEGGNEWQINGPTNFFPAVLRRVPKSRTADLFIEPVRKETGRKFAIHLTFDNNQTVEIPLRGGKADPHVRRPDVAVVARWVVQERQDLVGPGPSVGPDGIQDVRLALSRLSPKLEIKSVGLEGPAGLRWESGMNLHGYHNAELIRNAKDRTQADFLFQPERNLSGQTLRLTVTYANDRTDTTTVRAGLSEPTRAMPPVALPTLSTHQITGRWLGQDGSQVTGPGDVHVALAGLPTGRVIAAAVLSDAIRGLWVYRSSDRFKLDPEPGESPLVLRRGADRGHADLFFPPYRDESGTTLTLRLIFADGDMAIAQIAGGACDPTRRVAGIAPTSIVAKPGDDLNDLANRFGTVKLLAGTYRLSRPLVLNHPVALIGVPGAIVQFAQGPGEPPWTTAIKVHCGQTTLQGFAVRFDGPVRWNQSVSYGPAVIGTTDMLDNGHNELKVGLTFSHLDLETPLAANPGGWEDALRLMRLTNAKSGRIEGNILRGGVIELFDGPWQVLNNDYRGTVPGTFTSAVVATHYTYDLVVRGNRARPVGPSGKTWRFLVMVQYGTNDLIENNTIEAIGARDDDTIPWANAPEIILTEAYHVHFEGKLSALSPDGRLIRIAQPMGRTPQSGDVVSVLDGPHAGQWRRIAQVINPSTYLLDEPLPQKVDVISIATGFINETIQGNTIDTRGGSKADNLVLPGNHFGTKVRNNRLLGGNHAFRISACPTESPVFWGWSHAPFFGLLIEGNTFEDSEAGGVLGVEHSQYNKTNQGRTYMTLTLRENTIRWTEPFLSRLARGGAKGPPPGLVVGYRPSLDPGELVVTAEGNRLEAPASAPRTSALVVHAALLNGRRTVDQTVALPPAGASASGRARDPDSRQSVRNR
jgi:hypothetical protein